MGIPAIRADLAQHVMAGAAVGSAAAGLLAVAGSALGVPGLRLAMPAAAVGAALAAGAVKEVADWLANRRWYRENGLAPRPHEVSSADLAATVLGGVFVAVPVFLALWGGR